MARSERSFPPSFRCCSGSVRFPKSCRLASPRFSTVRCAIRAVRSSGRFARSVTPSFSGLDDATRVLVRLSAVIAAGSEAAVRHWIAEAARCAAAGEVEELLLQSYLFCGFPRALNATREWRRATGVPAPASDEAEDIALVPQWRTRGEQTCAAVYGDMYEK